MLVEGGRCLLTDKLEATAPQQALAAKRLPMRSCPAQHTLVHQPLHSMQAIVRSSGHDVLTSEGSYTSEL